MKVRIDRRGFLGRAAMMLPLFHVGAWGNRAAAMPRQSNRDQDHGPNSADPARFATLRLRTAPLDDMAAFYRDTLGLPCSTRDDVLQVTAGQTALEFRGIDDGSRPYYHFAFNIPHNKLDVAIEWMKPRVPLIRRHGTDEVVFHFERWNAHAIYFLDPAGNIVEFIARHTLDNERKGAFGVEDILCASEMGVVTPDVADAAQQLKQACSLEDYHGAGPEFTAVGDEHGLFIVVKTGRKWFSSDRAAEVFEAGALVRNLRSPQPLRIAGSRFDVEPAPTITR